MKKLMKLLGFLLLLAIIVLALYFGFGGGFGKGNGDTKFDGDTKAIIEQEETKTEESKESEEITRENTPDETEDFAGTILKINVVGNDYYYDNERTTLDDFMSVIASTDVEIVVEVNDDNASLNAYNALIEKLKENNIDYVEK